MARISFVDYPDKFMNIKFPKVAVSKPKIIAVFYHGGPFGSGQIKATSDDDTGDTGKIYDVIVEFSKQTNREFIGAIIAPAAVQYSGVSTGEFFIKKNYKEGDQIIIYGYSYGGDNAVNLAENLKMAVDIMIIVDSSDGIFRGTTVDTSVSKNVKLTINIFQKRASGGSSRSGSNSDNPNSSENSSSDGSSNTMGSRGFPHSAEGDNAVINIDLTAKDVTHGNIQRRAKNKIEPLLKTRIYNYELSKK